MIGADVAMKIATQMTKHDQRTKHEATTKQIDERTGKKEASITAGLLFKIMPKNANCYV